MTMDELYKFVTEHSFRGVCNCGKCIDAQENPQYLLTGHTSDLIFFKVAINSDNPPSKEEFIKVINAHKGEFCDVNLFDGKEHNYLEIGGWAGDQGLALMIMGLGELLGCWMLLTPKNFFPTGFDEKLIMELAGQGLISIQVSKKLES